MTDAAPHTTTIGVRIDALVAQHGSLRTVAKVLGTDAGYLSRLRAGKKCSPSARLLRRLGLRRFVTVVYEQVKP